MGVVLTGGHTSEGVELAAGFSVTGYQKIDHKFFRKGGMEVGDQLILTKPLGSGALLAALMRGECRADWFEKLKQSMLLSNQKAAEIFSEADVRGCTDVTGFGLAGHLFEMLDQSRVSARISTDSVPQFDGFSELSRRGILSTLHGENAKRSRRIESSVALPEYLFDPQTSGGLMAAVKSDRVDGVLWNLRESGHSYASRIGEVVASNESEKIHLV
jgi:selenide,water dikinase